MAFKLIENDPDYEIEVLHKDNPIDLCKKLTIRILSLLKKRKKNKSNKGGM